MISFKTAPLQHSLQLISSLCDGANKRDGYGFNRYDSEYGHMMANIDESEWSPEDQLRVYYLLQKYQRQLRENGIEFHQIVKPKVETKLIPVSLNSLERF